MPLITVLPIRACILGETMYTVILLFTVWNISFTFGKSDSEVLVKYMNIQVKTAKLFQILVNCISVTKA